MTAFEKHYTIPELSKHWHLAKSTLIDWFRDEPGVLKHGPKKYVTLRIPESVALRVYRRHIQGEWTVGRKSA